MTATQARRNIARRIKHERSNEQASKSGHDSGIGQARLEGSYMDDAPVATAAAAGGGGGGASSCPSLLNVFFLAVGLCVSVCTLKSAHARMHRKEKDIVPRTNRRARSSKSSGKKGGRRRGASSGVAPINTETHCTRGRPHAAYMQREREREGDRRGERKTAREDENAAEENRARCRLTCPFYRVSAVPPLFSSVDGAPPNLREVCTCGCEDG